jgi:hypothetical protein
MGFNKFERDAAVGHPVLPEPNLAHAPLSEKLNQLITADH